MEEDKALNLVQRLAKVRSICDAVSKSKKGYGYTYADIVEILAKAKAGMEKYGVSLIPMIVPGTSRIEQVTTVNTGTDRSGKTFEKTVTESQYTGEMIFRWVNNDNPEETIEVPWFVTGSQSDPSQAMGGGLTYAQRQFLTAYFQIAQPDSDPDTYRTKQREAEQAEAKALTEKIIAEFDEAVKLFLSDHPDKGDELKKFVSRFVRSGDYRKITNPELAGKMLREFKATYIGKD